MDAAVTLRIATLAVLALVAAGVFWVSRLRIKPERREQMPFLEHVEELRKRLLLALGAWTIGMVVAFSFRYDPDATLWFVPAVQDNIAAQVFRVITAHLVPPNVDLIVTRPIDGFVAELWIAVGIGFALAMPIFLWQFGRFLSPALRPQEKRILAMALLPATGLFAVGAAFAWSIVLPFLLETLYGYSTALGAQTFLTLDELVRFTITTTLVFGLSFQTPLVMYALARTGVTSAASYAKYWRHATVAIFVFAAIVTDPTIISQFLVAGPMVILYVLGIAAARVAERQMANADDSKATTPTSR